MLQMFGLNFSLKYNIISDNCILNNEHVFNVTEEKFIFKVPDIATYMVEADSLVITIDKCNQAVTDEQVALYLNGTVMAYLLQKYNYLVLHGSAIMVNGQAMIFSGESGAGKSTLATALAKHNHHLLTDDVAAICKTASGDLVLKPGLPRVKLWEDALTNLNINQNNLKPILNKINKYELPIENFHNDQVPILALYELCPMDDVEDVVLTELYGYEKLQTIIRNTYRYSMLKPMNKLKEHLTLSTQLANEIRVFKIVRPSKRFCIDEIMDCLKSQLLNL